MADKTINQLTEATEIGNSDLFVLAQGGVAKKLAGSTFLNSVSRRAELVIDTLSVEVADDIRAHVSARVTSLPSGVDPTVQAISDSAGNLIFVFGIPAAEGEGVKSVDGIFPDSTQNIKMNALRSDEQELTGDIIEEADGSITITGQKGQIFNNLGLGSMAVLDVIKEL